MRGLRWIGIAATLAASACSILVSLDGYTGGQTDTAEAGAPDASPDVDAAPDPCSGAPSDPALVGYYRFDELTGGVVHDCSGRGHDGIIVDTPDGGSWGVGRFGAAVQMDAVHGCVDLGAPADFALAGSAFSVTAWIWVRTFGGTTQRYIIGRTRDPKALGWRFAAQDVDQIQLKVAQPDASSFETTAAGIPSQTWVNVAAVYEPGGQTELWSNGLKIASQAAPPIVGEDQAATLRIGCRAGNGFYFDGKIDDVRIYARKLTAAEIAAIAAAK